MTPFAAPPDYPHWGEVATLIHHAFAYMEQILGHPARAAQVTPDQLAEAANNGTAYLVEQKSHPVACLFTRPSRDYPDALYLGWLAVDDAQRGQRLAAHLLTAAENEARTMGYAAMTLDTGRAITQLHRFFLHAGFASVPGSGNIITFRKKLP